MKRTITLSVRFLLLISALTLCSTLSCRHIRDDESLSKGLAAINDTLRNGNVDAAIRMTDEIKRQSIAAGDSAAWSEAMVQQGVNAYYQANPPMVVASSDSALYWLERQKPSPAIASVLAKAYQTKGAYYDQYYFNADSNIFYLRKAVDNFELSGKRIDLPQAYGNYANALRMSASLDSAAIYYHKAISIADSLQLDIEEYIPLYNGIAGVLSDMRDSYYSAIWWDKSMAILGSMNHFDKFNTLTGYGNHLYYIEDFEGSRKIFTCLKNMLDSIPGTEWETMFTNVNIADTYIRTGRPKEGTAILDIAEEYFTKEQPNPTVISYIQTLRMRAATELKDYNSGLELAKMHPESDTLRLEQHLARLKAMENLYEGIGNYRQAYLTRSRHDHLADSLRSDHIRQQMSAMTAIYQRDNRILTLEAGNSEKQTRIYKLTTAIAIAIAIIIALTLFFVVRRARLKRREDRMMKKIICLRQENLRNRVTPHFIYNALNHELHNASNGKTSHLDSLVSLIRRQQIIASEILIPFSEELKFTDDYISVMSDNGRDNLEYNYNIDPTINPDFLFPSMTLQILVENAFKHGFSTLAPGIKQRIDIDVRRVDSTHIAVSVFNNTGEFKSGAEKVGTGLRVLAETIRLINEHNKEQTHFTINTDTEYGGILGCKATITLPDNLKP